MKYLSKKEQDIYKKLWKRFEGTGYLPFLYPSNGEFGILITDNSEFMRPCTLIEAFTFIDGIEAANI